MPALADLRRALPLGLAAVLLAGACGVETGSASPAVHRLRRMLEAEATLAYQGSKEVDFGSPGLGRRWFFVTKPAGRTGTVESIGEPVGRGGAWPERAGCLAWLADVDLLLRNYHVETVGRERVVDRDGVVLVIRSLHSSRPSARLVVDEATGLLLSAEFHDWKGSLTYSTRFRTLLLGPDLPGTDRSWDPAEGARSLRAPVALAAEVPFTPLRPRYLPEGFTPVRDQSGARFAETVYSDGLGWIWLSQGPARAGEEERVVHQRVEGSRVRMSLVLGGVALRLVGRLDPAELLRVLESLCPEPQARISTAGDLNGVHRGDLQARRVLLAVSEDDLPVGADRSLD